MRVAVASDTRRFGDVVLGGSPARLFRLTGAGTAALDRWAGGARPEPGAETTLAWRLVDAGVVELVVDTEEMVEGGGDSPDALTIVVPTHGRAEQLGVGLLKLRAAHPSERIIVVDDGSPDAGAIAVVAAAAGAEVIRRDSAGGAAAARNAGLALVETPLVAFVDSDVEVGPGWHSPLRSLLMLERVALVAPRVRAPSGPTVRARYDAARSPLDLGTRASPVRPGGRVSYLPAAAVVARTEAIRSVGGFDESLRVGEDVDLLWRLHEAEWRIRYEPSSAVLHRDPPERAPLGGWVARRMAYGTSAAVLEQRHPGSARPLVASAWSVAVWGPLACGHPVAAALALFTSSAALIPKLTGVPPSVAFRLGIRGHLAAGEQTARALVRPWWPLTVAAAVFSRRARRILPVVAVLPAMVDRRRRRETMAPLAWIAWSTLDDASYGLGVWLGALRARSVASLCPRRPASADPQSRGTCV